MTDERERLTLIPLALRNAVARVGYESEVWEDDGRYAPLMTVPALDYRGKELTPIIDAECNLVAYVPSARVQEFVALFNLLASYSGADYADGSCEGEEPEDITRAAIDPRLVSEIDRRACVVRDRTGAGYVESLRALQHCGGDLSRAVDHIASRAIVGGKCHR